MNTEQYRVYIDDLMAALEGAADPAVRQRLEAHWAQSQRDAADYAALQSLDAELHALAESASPVEVDLLAGVQAKVAAHQAFEAAACAEEDPAESRLMATVLNEAGDEDSESAEEAAALCAMDAALTALADGMVYPEVDLVDEVLARAAAEQATAAIPTEIGLLLESFAGGELDANGYEALETAASENPAVAQAWRDLQAIDTELTHLAALERKTAPTPDLVDAVLASVRDARPAPDTVTPFKARPKPLGQTRRRTAPQPLALGLLLAACVVLVLGLVIVQQGLGTAPDTPGPMAASDPRPGLSTPSRPKGFEDLVEIPKPIFLRPSPEASSAPTPERKTLSLADAIEARRLAALEDPQARRKLDAWSGLTDAEARALLEKADLALAAQIGLSQFLDPEAAAAALEAAVAADPENPYLQLALAQQYAASPEGYAKALEALAQVSALDPENSLPYYLEAQMAFATGDSAGAMAALAMGAQLDTADTYALASANYRDDALEASGLSSEVARFLAASNAGAEAYAQLTELGQELLQYGAFYESEGDTETAEEIYAAVNGLGAQVVNSAAFANEQLAGYDMQLSALDALNGIYEILAAPESQQVLAAAYNGVRDGLVQLGELMADLETLFASEAQDQIAEAVELSLEGGNLSLWDPRQ